MIALPVLLLASVSMQTPPPDDYAKTWDSVAQMIRTRYWARVSRKSTMEQLLESTKPKAIAAKSRAEFSKSVNAMIDAFGDSHFDFFTPSDQAYYVMESLASLGRVSNPAPHLDAWFKWTPDGYTVQMEMERGQLAEADVRKGDIIESIDGKPFSPVESMLDKVGKSAVLKLRRGSTTLTKQVVVQNAPLLDMFLNGSRRSARIIESGSKKIGYFHLWTQANEAFKNELSNAVYGPLRKTDAFILDLRDGFGGRPEGYADPFFRPEVTLKWTFGESTSSDQLFGYGRPLVVLINGGSRSAKEVLSYILKTSKRAVLIGSTTAGHVLGTSPAKVNDWSYLEIPMVQLETDGIRLEGKGVEPDIVVPREYDANGKDLYIEAALKYLNR